MRLDLQQTNSFQSQPPRYHSTVPRPATNDLILVKQSAKSIYDTFLKTVSPLGKRKTNHRSKMVHATYNGQTFSSPRPDIDSTSPSIEQSILPPISLSSMYLYFP